MFTKHDSCDFHKSTDAALASKVDIATLLTAVHKTVGCILSNIIATVKLFEVVELTYLKRLSYRNALHCYKLSTQVWVGWNVWFCTTLTPRVFSLKGCAVYTFTGIQDWTLHSHASLIDISCIPSSKHCIKSETSEWPVNPLGMAFEMYKASVRK